jgi:hypothetical protein
MASLAQIYAFTFGNPDFKQRFAAARMQAAWDIIGEVPQIPERREWAKKIFASPSADLDREYNWGLAHPTIQTKGTGTTDAELVTVVSSLVNDWIVG